MKKLSVVTVLIVVIMIQACKPKADNALENYNRGQMLSSMYTNAIAPLYQDFATQATLFNNSAQAFAAAPNSTSFNALQQQWITTQHTWQKCEPINVGDVRESFINAKINSWPTNNGFIEGFIADTVTLNENFIHSKGTTSKGLPALEYLLFADDNNAQLQLLLSDPRRIQYLVAVAADLYTNADAMQALWTSYKPTFIAGTSLTIDGSTNLLVNALLEYVEFVKNDKVGTPLGKKTNSIVQPGSVESGLSNTSVQHILDNLDGVDAMLNGTSTANNGNGLYTYLDAVDPMADGTKLSDKIKAEMVLCRNATNGIEGTLEEAVVNNPAQVDALYLELKKLTVLLKVEMTSILGVTVTFTDNDGD